MIVEFNSKKSSIKRVKGLSKHVNVEVRKEGGILVLRFTFNNLMMNRYTVSFYDDISFPVEISRDILKGNLEYLFESDICKFYVLKI